MAIIVDVISVSLLPMQTKRMHACEREKETILQNVNTHCQHNFSDKQQWRRVKSVQKVILLHSRAWLQSKIISVNTSNWNWTTTRWTTVPLFLVYTERIIWKPCQNLYIYFFSCATIYDWKMYVFFSLIQHLDVFFKKQITFRIGISCMFVWDKMCFPWNFSIVYDPKAFMVARGFFYDDVWL